MICGCSYYDRCDFCREAEGTAWNDELKHLRQRAADADHTISDLLDQCARLRGLMRSETRWANHYHRYAETAERERDEWARLNARNVAAWARAESERDEARRDFDNERADADALEERAEKAERERDELRERLRAESVDRSESDREWADMVDRERARCDELRAQLHRWQHGQQIESDYICDADHELLRVTAERDELRAKLERWEKAERVHAPLGGLPHATQWARVPEDSQ
jgi:chromosome segregation ATPase